MKHSFNRVRVGFFFLLLMLGCGNKDTANNLDVEGNGTEKIAAAHVLTFPVGNGTGLTDPRKLPKGEYALVGIQIYGRNPQLNTQAHFERVLKNPGGFSQEDHQFIRTEWAGMDRREGRATSLHLSLNVPYSIATDVNKIEFRNRHFYWISVHSNGDWRWKASGRESPAGTRFTHIFEEKNQIRATPTYFAMANLPTHEKPKPEDKSGISSKGTTLRENNDVVFIVELTRPDSTVYVAHIRYRKK